MADMGVTKARSEVQRMLLPFQALKSLDEVLEVAEKAENDLHKVKAEYATTKNELDKVTADLKLTQASYDAKAAEVKSGLASLQDQFDRQEQAQREKLDALKQQVAEVEKARDVAREAALQEMRRMQDDAARKNAELAREHEARVALMQMEEADARRRLEAAKQELNQLLDRVRL